MSESDNQQAPPMKLDTVFNMIDSVTDEMTYHKEKVSFCCYAIIGMYKLLYL